MERKESSKGLTKAGWGFTGTVDVVVVTAGVVIIDDVVEITVLIGVEVGIDEDSLLLA